MNTIITVKRLVELLASHAKIPQHKAQTFIEVFTYEIKNGLIRDKFVKIKDLGEFKVDDDKIIFVPDKTFAQIINAPFAMFDSEELADGITPQELSQPLAPAIVPEAKEIVDSKVTSEATDVKQEVQEIETVSTDTHEQEILAHDNSASMPLIDDDQIIEEDRAEKALIDDPSVKETIVEVVTVGNPSSAEVPIEENTIQELKIKDTSDADSAIEEPKIKESSFKEIDDEEPLASPKDKEDSFPTFWVIIGLITGLILGIGIGFFVHDPIQEILEPSLAEEDLVITEEELSILDIFPTDSSDAIQTEEIVNSKETPTIVPSTNTDKNQTPSVSVPEKDVTSSPNNAPLVYDVVTSNLGALSKKHYGNKSYWVYIYIENQDIIPNPNRVSANTKLIIPPLEKYATQPTEAERKAAANKLASEILSKHK